MVRILVLYNTPTDAEEFNRYYREVHIPLVLKMPGLRRFVTSRNAVPLSGEPYHLVAELDFDDMDAMGAAFASPEGQATADDVPKFATGGTRMMVYELHEHA